MVSYHITIRTAQALGLHASDVAGVATEKWLGPGWVADDYPRWYIIYRDRVCIYIVYIYIHTYIYICICGVYIHINSIYSAHIYI